jgi:hypothetical protein
LAQRYQEFHGINRDKVLLAGSKKPSKKGTLTGKNSTDRAKCGTAIHLATDERGLPLGAVMEPTPTMESKLRTYWRLW